MKKRSRRKDGSCPESDNYERLCVHTTTLAHDVSDMAERYLSCAKDMGRLNLKSKLFAGEKFPWFQICCEDKIGEEQLGEIIKKELADSSELRKYVELNWKNDEMPSEKHLLLADEIYQRIKDNHVEEMGHFIILSLINRGRWEELNKLADYYRNERDKKIKSKILKIFDYDAADYLNLDELFADAYSDNEELKFAALDCLSGVKNKMVHKLALTYERNKKTIPHLILLLVKNYQPEDEELLTKWLKSLPVSGNRGDWHHIFYTVEDIFHDKSVENPPCQLLTYMYEKTLCSFCREEIVEEMGKRGMLKDEVLIECRYDCNDSLREYADELWRERNGEA